MRDEGHSQWRRISKRQKHPQYIERTLQYDFMILKLAIKVEDIPTAWITPYYNDIPSDADLVVAGFGSTAAHIQITNHGNGTFGHTVLDTSEILRYGNDDRPAATSRMDDALLKKASLAKVVYNKCNANNQYAGFIDQNTMLCAGREDDGSDVCKLFFALFV
jgi:hypothetical protein